MRLLLDAHLSGRRTGRALRDRGHDVRAVQEDRHLDGWADEALLELAHSEDRVLVTCNVRDFARIAGVWSEAGRHHSGLLLVVRTDHSEYGALLRAIDRAAAARPLPLHWVDYVAFA